MNCILRCLIKDTKLLYTVSVQQQRTIKRWVAPTLKAIQKRVEKMPPVQPPKRSAFLEWNYGAELFAFANRLGETFDNALLREALVQPDFVEHSEREQQNVGLESTPLRHNQDLAEEGRHLASQYISDFVKRALPGLPEDGVRALHDHLLSEEVLAKVSFYIGTKDLIMSNTYEPTKSSYSRTLLAIVGALARSNTERANLLVRDLLVSQLTECSVADLWSPADPWTELQQTLAKEGIPPVEARLAHETGAGTLLSACCVAVYSDKVMLGKGYGENVKEARDMAALDALRRLYGTTDAMKPLFSTSH